MFAPGSAPRDRSIVVVGRGEDFGRGVSAVMLARPRWRRAAGERSASATTSAIDGSWRNR